MSDTPAHPVSAVAGPPPSITVCPDGPYLVRGDVPLLTTDGQVVERGAGTIALCRCGKTGRAPFCDGTHKLAARERAGQPYQRDQGAQPDQPSRGTSTTSP